MKDCCNRTIDYLRISVTDRCNLRCVYCMPEGGVPPLGHESILTYEEIMQIAAVAKQLGISHVRITGGEPLVRKNIAHLVEGLKNLGFPDISMTTNGILLAPVSQALKDAGLDRVNISLDTLDREKFAQITRRGKLEDALSGIESALDAGLNPVKINTVVTSLNFGEVRDMASLTYRWPLHVRFIEVMPIGPEHLSQDTAVPIDQIMDETTKLGRLEPVPGLPSQGGVKSAGPARTFKLANALGTIGFIGAISHPFCNRCNRLRLTADGKIRPCLADDVEIDLIPVLRQSRREFGQGYPGLHRGRPVTGGAYGEVAATHVDGSSHDIKHCVETGSKGASDVSKLLGHAFDLAISLKPQGHKLGEHHAHTRRMCQIGG